MTELRKLFKDADENTYTRALAYMIGSIIIAAGIIMSALIIAASFLWGWIGLISIIAAFIVTILALGINTDE